MKRGTMTLKYAEKPRKCREALPFKTRLFTSEFVFVSTPWDGKKHAMREHILHWEQKNMQPVKIIDV